jgi:hypothetical protein
MSLRNVGRIQLSDDPAFSRKSWKAERAGWFFLAAFLIAGFLGLLGPGLLPQVTREEASGVQVSFDRFGRHLGEATIRCRLKRESPESRRATLWIDGGYLDGVAIQSITPPPVEARADSGGSSYSFALEPGADALELRFEISYRNSGPLRGRLGRSAARAVELRQFVYP